MTDNEYYRKYRDKNRLHLRKYNTEYQRKRRARLKQAEAEKQRQEAAQDFEKQSNKFVDGDKSYEEI